MFNFHFYFSGSLQGAMGQLWAHGFDSGRPGFLYGLFDQSKTLGLISDGDSNPGPLLHIKKRQTSTNKLDKIVKNILKNVNSPRAKISQILSVNFLLLKILANLPSTASLHFLFSKSKNFIFLLGLHIRIFHSLAFSNLLC